MKYTLNSKNKNFLSSVKKMFGLMKDEKKGVIVSLVFIILDAVISTGWPVIISYIIDSCIANRDMKMMFILSGVLLGLYIIQWWLQCKQGLIMGGVGKRILFNIRNKVFKKLQELPVAFFNQNKVGDLISRINNDTEKLSQFFAQAFMQFFQSLASMVGIGVFVIVLNPRLGVISFIPAIFMLIITNILSGWIKRRNIKELQVTGDISAEIEENLDNFKVIAVFNRADYLNDRFDKINNENFKVSFKTGVANGVLNPIFLMSSNVAQIITLCFGIIFITKGDFTAGLLISYLLYVDKFYSPLRRFANIWSIIQSSLAALDRIYEILNLESDIKVIDNPEIISSNNILEFRDVSFKYNDDKVIFENINLSLEKGKTYALVGPTGGGKTTTALLMSRLYDPTSGKVFLNGKDIRGFSFEEKSKKIGYILQEPFLFTGTIKDNIVYGNEKYLGISDEDLINVLKEKDLDGLLDNFADGINTEIIYGRDNISLGQKQIVAFIRVILRDPEILILDEATANIDTVTEQILEDIINKISSDTTKIIIAHRLNTIENADKIFFVNREIKLAGSFENAVDMLMNGVRKT